MWSYLLCMIVISSAAQNIYDVTTAGAVGDGKTDDAQAIQRMIDRCSAEGGGRVLLPRNHVFMAGPLELKSNVELYLEATATLKAHPDESIYHLSAFGKNEGEGMFAELDGSIGLEIVRIWSCRYLEITIERNLSD